MQVNTDAAPNTNRLTLYIVVALFLGIGVGYACYEMAPDAEAANSAVGCLSIVSDIFLRLIWSRSRAARDGLAGSTLVSEGACSCLHPCLWTCASVLWLR